MMDVRVFIMRACLLLWLALCSPAILEAGNDCTDRVDLMARLGIAGFDCNCQRMTFNDGRSLWRFGSEPEIKAVKAFGPAWGQLEEGDRIVAIDGALITTREGGERLSDWARDDPVRLTIRRGLRQLDVDILPERACPEEAPPAPPSPPPEVPAPLEPSRPLDVPAPLEPSPPSEVQAPPSPPAMPERVSRVWLGFALSCQNCSLRIDEADGTLEWNFEEPPSVKAVDPGSPAAHAGIERGDRLTHIDRVPLPSPEGGRMFSSLNPGQRAVLTVERDGAERNISLTVGDRADAGPARPQGPTGRRYSGVIGDVNIDVRSERTFVVSESEEGREVRIVTSDATIRLWLD